MARKYTAEQIAARLAWTREWRKRNKAKIQAWEVANRDKRRLQAKKRRRANLEEIRKIELARSRRRAAERRAYAKRYRLRQLAINPNWNAERMRIFLRNHPGYWSEVSKRRRLRLAWLQFTKTCAANRMALTTNPTTPRPTP